jgi:hypothetical protein
MVNNAIAVVDVYHRGWCIKDEIHLQKRSISRIMLL